MKFQRRKLFFCVSATTVVNFFTLLSHNFANRTYCTRNSRKKGKEEYQKESLKKKTTTTTQELPNKNDRAGNLYSAPKLEQLRR